MSSCDLQGKCAKQVLQLVDTAIQLDMPKLLACCESHIAAESGSKFDLLQLASHLPVSSALRISKGLRDAYLKCRSYLRHDVPNPKEFANMGGV